MENNTILRNLLLTEETSCEIVLQMDNTASTTLTSACAGCKIKKKKCSEKCVLAPFFPQDDPQKFLLVKRVYGNAHVIKLLQMDNTACTTMMPPCAGCKIKKKKCSEKCVLAPFFPQNDPEKFLLLNRVFGNAHVIKLLQDLPAEHRGDAVRSMVYEANQRLRDPVNGCLGVINDLQKKVEELQSRLDSREAELASMSLQHANLSSLINTGGHEGFHPFFYDASLQETEDMDVEQLWEPLWT